MIVVKSDRDLSLMGPACELAQVVLDEVSAYVEPGLTTRQLDDFAAGRIASYGSKSAFLGYRNYPCHVCLSVNEQVVHGLATDVRLEFGDIISLDVGVFYNGFIGDTARTVAVGGCSVQAQRLRELPRQSTETGSWIYPGRSSDMLKTMDTVWFASLLAMASDGRCMRNHRFPTSTTARSRLSLRRE